MKPKVTSLKTDKINKLIAWLGKKKRIQNAYKGNKTSNVTKYSKHFTKRYVDDN